MKCRLSQIVICSLAFVTSLALSTTASADEYRKINRLARKIDNTAASIARESTHFVHSPYYSYLVHETHQLRQLACHVRDVAQTGCNLFHLQQDVLALGNSYRNLDAKLCLIERATPGCPNARRLRRLLDSVQRDLDRMVASVTCLLHAQPQVLQPLVQPHHGFGGPHTYSQGRGIRTISGMGSGSGHNIYHDSVRNEVRYPTLSGIQNQAVQRSASLENQIRSMRSYPSATLNLGGSRLSIKF